MSRDNTERNILRRVSVTVTIRRSGEQDGVEVARDTVDVDVDVNGAHTTPAVKRL